MRSRATRLRVPALVVLLAAVSTATLAAVSPYFIARFDGRLGPHLRDPDRAFVVTRGVIAREGPRTDPSALCCSSDRHYITTARADYLSTDWTYEVSFKTPARAPEELLFIGFGEAVPDPLFYNEPRNSLYFAIVQGTTGYALGWRVNAHDEGMWSLTYMTAGDHVGGPSGGLFTARIRKVGASATFEVLGTDVVVTVPDIAAAAPFLAGVPVRLFFGNALSNYRFDDMRVLPEKPQGCVAPRPAT
jgi:hypothetical protein